jgi:hypothetical protein
MARVFRFSSRASFHSEVSSDFAALLLKAPSQIRSRISRSFGLSLKIDDDPIHVSHDGRRIGLGSFVLQGETIHFVIEPKIGEPMLKSIVQALPKEESLHKFSRFEGLSSAGPTEKGEDDLTPAYLLGLLDEIVDASSRLLESSTRKREVIVQGGIKGRPLLARTVRDLELGRGTKFYCEVLDDSGLREYAAVLLETARSISSLLEEWRHLLPSLEDRPLLRLRSIASRMGVWNSGGFNLSMLHRLCRPPFPYGLKDILYKCLRYWQWRAGYRLSGHGHVSMGYHHLVIFLDRLFEKYVGESLNASCSGDYEWIESPRFEYQVDGLEDVSSDRKIEPDHCFVHRDGALLIVADAKYREDVASTEQAYQILSYVSYDYSMQEGFTNYGNPDRIVGLLVYPGTKWEVGTVRGFGVEAYCVMLPVKPQLYHPELHDFVVGLLR